MRTLYQQSSPLFIPAPGGGGGGVAGNIASFQFDDAAHPWGPDPVGGYSLTDGGGGVPGPNISRITTDHYTGVACMQGDFPAPVGFDGGGNCYLDMGFAPSQIWIVASLKVLTVPLTGVQTKKMVIFRQGGFNTQYGEMNMITNLMEWAPLTEGGSVGHDMGLYPSISSRVGLWDVYKLCYDQSTNHPVFSAGLNGVDNIYSRAYVNVTAQDASIIDFGGPLNDGSGACKYLWDRIEVGSVDPGWP
jgi:hypothetical protein